MDYERRIYDLENEIATLKRFFNLESAVKVGARKVIDDEGNEVPVLFVNNEINNTGQGLIFYPEDGAKGFYIGSLDFFQEFKDELEGMISTLEKAGDIFGLEVIGTSSAGPVNGSPQWVINAGIYNSSLNQLKTLVNTLISKLP